MSENKLINKPRQLWDNALRTVKGENTTELVEQFTSEMTLVAEGLCDDQARLRGEVEDLRRETDRLAQRTASEQESLDTSIHEQQQYMQERLDSLTRRIEALESKTSDQAFARREKESGRRGRHKDVPLLKGLIILAGILGGSWVLVTLLNLIGR